MWRPLVGGGGLAGRVAFDLTLGQHPGQAGQPVDLVRLPRPVKHRRSEEIPRPVHSRTARDDLDMSRQPVDEALQIDADVEQLVARIARRAAEEGRSDDTEDVVRKRMQIYAGQTAPVVDHYARKGLLSRVLGEGSIEEVFQRIRGVLQIRSS